MFSCSSKNWYPIKVALFYNFLILSSSRQLVEYRFLPGALISEMNAALEGYALETLYKQSQMQCHHACMARSWCKSYNHELATPGLCELNNKDIDHAQRIDLLNVRKGFIFVQLINEQLKTPLTCLDVLRNGAMASGVYRLYDNLPVYCDLSPEDGSAWTLIMSQSFANRAKIEFEQNSLPTNAPVSATYPNWEAYRPSLQVMMELTSHSTHWRVTCNYPRTGAINLDSVRYKLSDFNPFSWHGGGQCMKSEYVNMMGKECFGCTLPWYQLANEMLHTDTTWVTCGYGRSPLQHDANAFGFYEDFDPAFGCTSNSSATTNHWLGGYL